MSIYRKWFCTCTGMPVELPFQEDPDEEVGEPVCETCGASPSSDPKRTITFRDIEDWDD